MFDYLVVGAGFAGCTLAERLAGGARQESAARRQAAAHRRQRLRSPRRARRARPQVRPAHLPHQLARRVHLSVALHRVASRTSIACRRGWTAGWCRFRSTSTRSTRCTAPSFTAFELGEFFKSVAEPRDGDQDVGRRHRQPGRPGAVREILPQLHAQAVGPRSVRAGRGGDGASAGADQPRRSLFHRRLSGDAAAWATRGCSSACSRTRTSRSC